MADNRVQVDIVAENAQLKAKLAETEKELARFAAKGAKDGQGAAFGFKDLTASAGLFSKAMRFIGIPAMVLQGAQKLTTEIQNWRDRTRAFKDEVREAGRAITDASTNAQLGARGPAGARAAQRLKEAQELQEAITKIEGEGENGRLRKLKEKEDIQRRAIEYQERFIGNGRQRLGEGTPPVQALRETQRQIRIIEEEKDRVRKEFEKRREVEDADVARGLQRQVKDLDIQLAANDPELKAKLELEQKKQDIELQFQGETDAKLLALKAQLIAKTEELDKIAADRRAAARDRQIQEDLRAVQRAQTSGFGLNGGGPPSFAGTGTALQFLTDNIASFARTQGGGR